MNLTELEDVVLVGGKAERAIGFSAVLWLLTGGLLALLAMLYSSQVAGQTYSFEADTGRFSSIKSTGTNLPNPRGPGIENAEGDGSYNAISIGFEFEFFGRRITSLIPTTNMFLTTNADYDCFDITCRDGTGGLLGTGDDDPMGTIFPFWTNAGTIPGGTVASGLFFKRSGAEGDRVLTIEFNGFSLHQNRISFATIDVQVKLFEADGSIEFIYNRRNTTSGEVPASNPALIGIAATETFLSPSRYYTLKDLSSSPEITSNAPGEGNTPISQINTSTLPVNRPQTDQIYRFTPVDYYFPEPQDIIANSGVGITRVLPALGNAVGTVTYRLTNLPTGFTFEANNSPRTIAGSYTLLESEADGISATVTYTATDDLGTSSDDTDDRVHTRTFEISVLRGTDASPNFGSNTVDDISHSMGLLLPPVTLPKATGGNPPYQYTITPDLPTGLRFNPLTRVLSGTPTVAQIAMQYAYVATDLDGDPITLNFNITIAAGEYNLPEPKDIVALSGVSISRVLPALENARGSVTYELTNLPTGYSFSDTNNSPRRLSGSYTLLESDADGISATVTYTATDDLGTLDDADDQEVTRTFEFSVVMGTDSIPNFGSNTVADISHSMGLLLPPVTLPQATGGNAPYQYNISPALPTGLRFNPMTRVLSGTPTVTQSAMEYTYTATDLDEDMTTFNFDIAISAGEYNLPEPQDIVALSGVSISRIMPALENARGSVTYELTNLPTGYSFSDTNNSPRRLSGSRTLSDSEDAITRQVVTYTATDNLGTSSNDDDSVHVRTFEFSVFRGNDNPPSFGSNTINDLSHPVGLLLPPIILPQATGGNAPYQYTITPDLPAGLRLNALARVLSGTPTATQSAIPYTYTATDLDGDPITLNFNIAISATRTDFGLQRILDFNNLVEGVFTSEITLPEPETGTGPFSYTLEGAPVGVTLTEFRQLRVNIAEENVEAALAGSPHTITYRATSVTTGNDTIEFILRLERDISPSFVAGPREFTFNIVRSSQNIYGLRDINNNEARVPELTPGNYVSRITDVRKDNFPMWLSIRKDQSRFRGTIPADTSANQNLETTYMRFVADVGGEMVDVTLTLNFIDAIPVAPSISAINLTHNQEIAPIRLPEFTTVKADNDDFVYSISGLPNGLSFDPATRRITGTPDTVDVNPVTYTAIDGNMADTDSVIFNIEIVSAADPHPQAPIVDLDPIIFGAATNITLPNFVSGDGFLVYSLALSTTPNTPTETLANGLTFTPSNRTITGTVVGTAGVDTADPVTYIYTAVDDNGDTAYTMFTLEFMDTEPDFGSQTIDDFVILQNNDLLASQGQLPAATSLAGATYSLSPPTSSSITGLQFTSSTRTLQGTLSVAPQTAEFTYTATDDDGDTASLTFSVSVVSEVPQPGLSGALVFTVGQQRSISLSDNRPLLGFTNNQALPDGLVFNRETQMIAGTILDTAADEALSSGTYSYSVTDSVGNTSPNIEFTLTVLDPRPVAPPQIDPALLTFPLEEDITPATPLPEFTYSSGNPPQALTYTLTPLPPGLVFAQDQTTRLLSGNPTESGPFTATYTATDGTDIVSLEGITITIQEARPQAPTDDQNFIFAVRESVNQSLTPFTSNIEGDLTYTLASTPSLPTGLIFNTEDPAMPAITGAITGTSGNDATQSGRVTYTYTATHTNTFSTDATFTIAITDAMPEFDRNIDDINAIQGFAITAVQLPEVIRDSVTNEPSGTGMITYSLDGPVEAPNLPSRLTYNANGMRMLQGTPDTVMEEAITFTYSATDQDGDTATRTFTITVAADTLPVAPTISNFTFAPGQSVSETLTAFTGGNGDLMYSLTGTEPNTDLAMLGLVFDPAPAALTLTGNIIPADDGDPNPNNAGPVTFTYTATDTDMDSVETTFTISVVDSIPMPPVVTEPQTIEVMVGQAVSGANLMPFTGGDGTLTYALIETPTPLPTGLNFDPVPNNLGIAGTVMDTAGNEGVSTTYTYTATDTGGDRATATFTLTVVDPRPVAPTTVDELFTFTRNTRITDIELPNFTYTAGVTAPTLTHTLSNAAGVTISDGEEVIVGLTYTDDGTSRTISGTPNAPADATEFTYTASDGTDEVSLTFTIAVSNDPVPVAPQEAQTFSFTVGEPVSQQLAPFTISDGADNSVLTYSLTDGTNPVAALVGGLVYDPATRTISTQSGTLEGTAEDDSTDTAATYTYTATHPNSMTTDITVSISIVDEQPEFADGVGIGDIDAIVGVPLSDNPAMSITLPEVVTDSGTGDVSYSLLPTAPSGLTFTAADRTLAGAPDAQVMNETFTYTATDQDLDTVDLTFTITVEADTSPMAPTISNFTFVPGQPVSETLTAFTGGNEPITYSLTDGTEANTGLMMLGLEFINPTADVRTITGDIIPADDGDPNNVDAVTFTYTATDTNMDSAATTFTISVMDAMPMPPTAPQAIEVVVGQAVSGVTLMPFTGGDGTLTYALIQTPTPLPTGLSFNSDPDSLEISGTITDMAGDDRIMATTYTYTATDSGGDGDTTQATFTLTVVDPRPVAPSFGTEFPLTHNLDIAPIVLPEFAYSSGNPPQPLTYTLANGSVTINNNDEVATGLDYTDDGTTRTILGRPTVLTDNNPIILTYTASDGTDMESIMFTITVVDDSFPVVPAALQDIYTYIPGQDVELILPLFTLGDGTLTHRLADADNTNTVTDLVGNLSYDPESFTISGTVPATAEDDSDTATYTYSATDMDEDGEHDTTSTTFTITINDERPDFSDDTITDILILQGVDLTAVPLPVTDGTGMVTYSLTPTLPDGLIFDNNSDSSDPPMLSGSSDEISTATYTYMAVDEDGDTAMLEFSIAVQQDIEPVAPAIQRFVFAPGQTVSVTLDEFTGGNGDLTYSLTATPALPQGLEFNAETRVLSGSIAADTAMDDSVDPVTYTYMAEDQDNDPTSAMFTIQIMDGLVPPTIGEQEYTVGIRIQPLTLPEFTSVDPNFQGDFTYSLTGPGGSALPDGLIFAAATRVLSGTPSEATDGALTLTYSVSDALDLDVDRPATTTFDITIVDVPSLEDATTSAIPAVGANIALVAAQAISSRVELALEGLSQGIDIRTLDGRQFKLNPQRQDNTSAPSVRFGVWYSAASDDLSDTRSTITWSGSTDSSNLGFDVGFDLSPKATMVVGIMQNSASTTANYRNIAGGNSGTLAIDLDSTAIYVGVGYDWLDAWFANGSADSTLTDSARDAGIPASFSYQSIGITATFEAADSLFLGTKLESLTSDLSLAARDSIDYDGLQSDSSQFRTTFVLNYQFKLGDKDNGLLIPKFELGFRDLSLGSSIGGSNAAEGGSALETGFGLDYLQRQWGLTVGLDLRSIDVANYSSSSTQWQVRWESGNYGSGLAFSVKPHAVNETLGIDRLYTSNFNQYQSLLNRQYGGDNHNTKGLDLEMGYGIPSGVGTLTPYFATTNYAGGVNQARRQEIGLRYRSSPQPRHNLDLTVKMERSLTPETLVSPLALLGLSSSTATYMRAENAITFSTRYNF